MSDLLPPSSIQQSALDVDLNDACLQILLVGIYTVVYFGTVYVYLTRKSSREWIVLGALSLSYVIYAFRSGLAWYLLKKNFVDQGDTRGDTFINIYLYHTGWKTLLNDICAFVLAALADGLLIWRCFNVWNRSYRAILLPSFFLVSTISVDIAVIAIAGGSKLMPTFDQARDLDILIASSFCITCASTLTTTCLISYRIYSTLQHEILRGSKRWLRNIIEILAQSAAAYALASIGVVVTSLDNDLPLAASTYTSAFFNFTAGVAPLIIVARVVLTATTTSGDVSVTHISGLQFHHPATTMNIVESQRDSIQVEMRDSPLLKESEKFYVSASSSEQA